MAKKRPFGITILAILAGVAAVVAIYYTLVMFGLFNSFFGVFGFFGINWFGALMWGLTAVIWIAVMRWLWNVDPRGWLFVVALATLNLIFAILSLFGDSDFTAMLPAIIVNGAILLYCLLPGTKEAFEVPEAPAAAAAPVAPSRTTPAAVETAAPEVAAAGAAAAVAAGLAAEAEEEAPDAAADLGAGDVVAAGLATEEVASRTSTVDVDLAEPVAEMATEAAASEDVSTFHHDLAYVKGIGKEYAARLKEIGIDTPKTLLERGATPKGRQEIIQQTGISGGLILKWINHADLFRINGVGSAYAELLEAAGVDTVPEMAQRNPKNLHGKLVEVNEEKKHVGHMASEEQVTGWVTQAKELPRVITY